MNLAIDAVLTPFKRSSPSIVVTIGPDYCG